MTFELIKQATGADIVMIPVRPAGTPQDVIDRVNRDVASVLSLPDVLSRLNGLGMEIAPGLPEALGQFLRQEIATWRNVARGAGVKPE